MFFENDVFLQVTVFVGLFVSLVVARAFFSFQNTSCLELLVIFFCQKTNNFAMQFNQIFSIIVLAGNSKYVVSTCLEQNDPGHHWKH